MTDPIPSGGKDFGTGSAETTGSAGKDIRTGSADSIVSAGIDIGTSTTHLTISRLRLANVSSASRVPKIAVTDRIIIYQSAIYSTPLNTDGSINASQIAELLLKEYRNAKIEASQIQTGAVIITGETAKLRNADEVSRAIAELAGDFVVASAGPRLESQLAGRGAGAEEASREQGKTICNIDIGGGTSNYAVFRNGRLLDSACLDIGARCIQFDQTGKILKFTDSGETFLDGVAKLKQLPPGSNPDRELLKLIASLLAEVILHAASSATPPQIVQRLLNGDPLKHNYTIDEYWFSGGVAESMLRENQSDFAFGDMGIFLAVSLLAALAERQYKYKIAEHGIRATVIGAGMHTLQLSGCTVAVSENTLPMRNLRIIQAFAESDAGLEEEMIESKLSECLAQTKSGEESSAITPLAVSSAASLPSVGSSASSASASSASASSAASSASASSAASSASASSAASSASASSASASSAASSASVGSSASPSASSSVSPAPVSFAVNPALESRAASGVAIAICNLSTLSYSDLQKWARALLAAHNKNFKSSPLVILSKEDIALALGQTIKGYSPETELVILDNVDISTGDFVDIGRVLPNKQAVPLTVKTLIFR